MDLRWHHRSRAVVSRHFPFSRLRNDAGKPTAHYTEDDHGYPIELGLKQVPEDEYLEYINRIAWDVANLIKILENSGGKTTTYVEEKVPSERTVYLAECGYDRHKKREKIKAALKAEGYKVLPDATLPRMEEDYVAEVKQLLAQCRLSIHLVGEGHGGVPLGPSMKSVDVLQNELAIEQSKQGTLKRVIWLPENTASENTEQKDFIADLNQNAEAQFGADLITANFENLKSATFATLKKLGQPKPETPEWGKMNYYYVRIEQVRPIDGPGALAWASPMWIHVQR